MLIDRKHIEQWAVTAPSKSEMAELVMQLVMNTLPNDGSSYSIPIGSSTFIGGWDGLVESMAGHAFIPLGKSGWEFGARGDTTTKANNDYNTRTKGIPVAERQNMTFVFVTPYFWEDKTKWVTAQKQLGEWKDVIAYDSDSLSQWIYHLPIVTEWFAKKINIFPETGIILPIDKWDEISIGRNGIVLTPRFYTAGRERQVDELRTIIEGAPRLKAFRASSREEAMAFILAAGMSLPEPSRSKFMGKTVIVDSKASLGRMCRTMNAINIVTHLEDNSTVYAAATKNIVLVSLGPNDEFQQDVIELPVSNKRVLIEELKSYNIAEPEAFKIVYTNSCNLTLIRKELGFPPSWAKWIVDEDISELKPCLLLSRWNENFDGDTKILSFLWGDEYNSCQKLLNHWIKLSVSPLTQTGPIWRLTSPLMLWSEMALQLDESFFKILQCTFKKVFIDAEDNYSGQLKEGLLQTLIIVALYGERLRLPIGRGAQVWVDALIKDLLHDAGPEKWVEFSDNLPLIAEASPKIFTEELELAIQEKTPVVTALFEEENHFFYPKSHHTALLWALEALAWNPDYLNAVTRILLQLTSMDPGGQLSNRPFNSLVDIYLPWKPHTSVGLAGRLAILDECIREEYPDMWRLLLALLPHPGAVTSGTSKLKWRDYEFTEARYGNAEDIYKITEWAVDRLMTTFDGEDHHLATLIETMEPIDRPLRKKLILWLPSAAGRICGASNETRKALRETMWYQSLDNIELRYKLSEEEKASVEETYKNLTPVDLKEQHLWLFNDYFPHLPENIDDNEDRFANSRQIERLRKEACKELLEKFGADEVIAMKDFINEPQTLGSTLACFTEEYSITDSVCKLLGSEDDSRFVRGFFSEMEQLYGHASVIALFDECKAHGYTHDQLIALLMCLEQNKRLWEFIETQEDAIQKGYWERMPAIFWGGYKDDATLYMIRKLSGVGRGLDAMNDSWIYAKEMPTVVIEELMQSVLRSNPELNGRIDHHPLNVFIEQLHERKDANQDLLIHLEWMYLPVLRYTQGKQNLTLLNEKLSSDAEFAVQVMSFLYRSDKDSGNKIEEVSETDRANATRAFYLFNQWKNVPGVRKDNTIDERILTEWLKPVVEKASEKGILRPAYSLLGKLFAQYPEQADEAEKLFAAIEPIEEKSFFTSYNVGLFNKRGLTSRGPYEGGEIERDNAEHFAMLYEKYKTRYPRVTKVFKDLSEQYARMAKDMDNEADIAKLDY